MSTKNKKVLMISVICLVVLVAIFGIIYAVTRPETQTGTKNIVTEVVLADGTSTEYTISTDEEYLRGALEQEGLIEGREDEFGLYITTVQGVTADESKQEWWCITKGGEAVMLGVDQIPIADGEHYEITLTTGYDS